MVESMKRFNELGDKIKTLKEARGILNQEYVQTDFHKKKEASPRESVPPEPQDEEAIRLLTTIHKIDHYIKKYQEEQLNILKKHDSKI